MLAFSGAEDINQPKFEPHVLEKSYFIVNRLKLSVSLKSMG